MEWLAVIKALKKVLLQVVCIALVVVVLCTAVYVGIEMKATLNDVAGDYLSLVDRTRVGNSRDKFYEDFIAVYYGNSDITSEDNPDGLKNNKGDDREDRGNLKDGFAQDAVAFYSKCDVPKGNKTGVFVGDVELYDGLPWDTVNAYKLNESTSESYIRRYLDFDKISHTVVIDNNCSSSALSKDNVRCMDFAATSIMAFCDIDSAGSPIGWSVSTRPKKVCAILKGNDGKKYYLPLKCEGDAKGHSWPGGLMQTMLSNKQAEGRWHFGSDGGHIKGSIIDRDITNLNEIKSGYADVTYGGRSVNPQVCLEVNRHYHDKLRGTYTVTGFIVWKE